MTSARTLVWRGTDAPRMEIVHADVADGALTARGAQIGVEPAPYELRYELAHGVLKLDVVGSVAVELPLGDADFFDLEFSPVFNSLPVLTYGLHRGGEPRDFTMAWVSVPDLSVSRSEQRYEPSGGEGLVRFRSGSFTAEIEFDDDGFVVRYPGLAQRVYPPVDENQLF